jgi:hypothetical protein
MVYEEPDSRSKEWSFVQLGRQVGSFRGFGLQIP